MKGTDFCGLIGNTPLIRLNKASELTGCEILGKAEFLNPGGSIKDRTALGIVRDAEQRAQLKPGGRIVEGTAGNTGIGLCLLGNALGYETTIVVPESQSPEKIDVRLVPAVPYSDSGHYVHVSERLAEELSRSEPNGVVWANQFDNTANRDFHAATTGEEIWQQTHGEIDAFICSAGTGGTLAGVATTLRKYSETVKIGIADPDGSALYAWYTSGELKSEGDSITEGIGQSRVTENLSGTAVDLAYHIGDAEALQYVFQLLRHEGICLGGSSGINIAGAVRLAQDIGPGHVVVTVLCDYGNRYQSRLFNPAFLRRKKLPVPDWLD